MYVYVYAYIRRHRISLLHVATESAVRYTCNYLYAYNTYIHTYIHIHIFMYIYVYAAASHKYL